MFKIVDFNPSKGRGATWRGPRIVIIFICELQIWIQPCLHDYSQAGVFGLLLPDFYSTSCFH
jgi:hypothetical protein